MRIIHGDDLPLGHTSRCPAPVCRETYRGYLQIRTGNAFSYCLDHVELLDDPPFREAATFYRMNIDVQSKPFVYSLARL